MFIFLSLQRKLDSLRFIIILKKFKLTGRLFYQVAVIRPGP